MFFYVNNIKKAIILQPQNLKTDLQQIIEHKIISSVEGQVHPKYGWIISVIKIQKQGDGVISDNGNIVFMTEFAALTFKPFNGEILDGIVTRCVNHGLKVNVGPFLVFIDHQNMPANLNYCEEEEVFRTGDKNIQIRQGSRVRFRVVNYDAAGENRLYGSGSIDEDYLGSIDTKK